MGIFDDVLWPPSSLGSSQQSGLSNQSMAQQTANQSGLLNQQMAQSQQQMQHAQTQAQYEQLKMQVELQRAQQTCNHEMVTYCEPVEGRAVEPFCLHCRRTKKELVIKELKRVKS